MPHDEEDRGMVNSYAVKNRIQRNKPDESLAETQNYKLVKQLSDFVLCKKATGYCVKISHDCAMMIMEQHADIQELYSK